MKVELADGSHAEVSVEEFEMLADEMGWRPAPKTQAERLRAVLDEIKAEDAPKPVEETSAPEAMDFRQNSLVVEEITTPAVMPVHVDDFVCDRGCFRAANGQRFIPYTPAEGPIVRIFKEQHRISPHVALTTKRIATEFMGLTDPVQIKNAMSQVSKMVTQQRGIEKVRGRNAYRLTRDGKAAIWVETGKPNAALRKWREEGAVEANRRGLHVVSHTS